MAGSVLNRLKPNILTKKKDIQKLKNERDELNASLASARAWEDNNQKTETSEKRNKVQPKVNQTIKSVAVEDKKKK